MMNIEDYCVLLNDAIKRNETVVVGCRCIVKFSGRAESVLEEGDRVLMIKADKVLLVHQPSGNNPINYLKPNASHSMKLIDGKLFLKSSNLPLKEYMDIEIKRIYFYNSHKLEDGQSIVVIGTEQDMSNMIYKNPELVEKGFKPVSQEEQTKYGFIDVMGLDKEGVLTIVECKRFSADLSAVTQLRRYVEKIMVSKGITKVRGIMAAPKITANAKTMLEDWGFKFVSIKPPKLYEKFDKTQSSLDLFRNG